eukprot:s5497_g3.t1
MARSATVWSPSEDTGPVGEARRRLQMMWRPKQQREKVNAVTSFQASMDMLWRLHVAGEEGERKKAQLIRWLPEGLWGAVCGGLLGGCGGGLCLWWPVPVVVVGCWCLCSAALGAVCSGWGAVPVVGCVWGGLWWWAVGGGCACGGGGLLVPVQLTKTILQLMAVTSGGLDRRCESVK